MKLTYYDDMIAEESRLKKLEKHLRECQEAFLREKDNNRRNEISRDADWTKKELDRTKLLYEALRYWHVTQCFGLALINVSELKKLDGIPMRYKRVKGAFDAISNDFPSFSCTINDNTISAAFRFTDRYGYLDIDSFMLSCISDYASGDRLLNTKLCENLSKDIEKRLPSLADIYNAASVFPDVVDDVENMRQAVIRWQDEQMKRLSALAPGSREGVRKIKGLGVSM